MRSEDRDVTRHKRSHLLQHASLECLEWQGWGLGKSKLNPKWSGTDLSPLLLLANHIWKASFLLPETFLLHTGGKYRGTWGTCGEWPQHYYQVIEMGRDAGEEGFLKELAFLLFLNGFLQIIPRTLQRWGKKITLYMQCLGWAIQALGKAKLLYPRICDSWSPGWISFYLPSCFVIETRNWIPV